MKDKRHRFRLRVLRPGDASIDQLGDDAADEWRQKARRLQLRRWDKLNRAFAKGRKNHHPKRGDRLY